MKKFFSILMLILFPFMLISCSSEVKATRETIILESDVATLTLFSFDGKNESGYGIRNYGHAFLCLKNTSESSFKLAGKEVAPNEEITFSSWSIKKHFGIWFNVESGYIAHSNKYNGRKSIETGVSLEDIEKLSKQIEKHDKWNPIYNCSKFVVGCWNIVVSESEQLKSTFILTPNSLIKQMKEFKNLETNKAVIKSGDCGYFSDKTNMLYHFEKGEIYA